MKIYICFVLIFFCGIMGIFSQRHYLDELPESISDNVGVTIKFPNLEEGVYSRARRETTNTGEFNERNGPIRPY